MTKYSNYIKGGELLIDPTLESKDSYILKCSECEKYFDHFDKFVSHCIGHYHSKTVVFDWGATPNAECMPSEIVQEKYGIETNAEEQQVFTIVKVEPSLDGYCKDEKPQEVPTDNNSQNVESNDQDSLLQQQQEQPQEQSQQERHSTSFALTAEQRKMQKLREYAASYRKRKREQAQLLAQEQHTIQQQQHHIQQQLQHSTQQEQLEDHQAQQQAGTAELPMQPSTPFALTAEQRKMQKLRDKAAAYRKRKKEQAQLLAQQQHTIQQQPHHIQQQLQHSTQQQQLEIEQEVLTIIKEEPKLDDSSNYQIVVCEEANTGMYNVPPETNMQNDPEVFTIVKEEPSCADEYCEDEKSQEVPPTDNNSQNVESNDELDDEYQSGAPGPSTKNKLRTEIVHEKCVTTYSRQDFQPSETQSTDNESQRGSPLQIIADIVIEHDNNQMEHAIVDIATENNRSAGLSEDSQVPGVSTKKQPKTAAQSAREYRERQKLAKSRLLQPKSNQNLDAIASTSTSQVNQRAGLSEDSQIAGVSTKIQAKTAAESMREYRKRQKLAKTRLLQPKSNQDLDAIVSTSSSQVNERAGLSEDSQIPGVSTKKQPKTSAQSNREYRERQKLGKPILLHRQSNQDLDAIVSTSSSQSSVEERRVRSAANQRAYRVRQNMRMAVMRAQQQLPPQEQLPQPELLLPIENPQQIVEERRARHAAYQRAYRAKKRMDAMRAQQQEHPQQNEEQQQQEQLLQQENLPQQEQLPQQENLPQQEQLPHQELLKEVFTIVKEEPSWADAYSEDEQQEVPPTDNNSQIVESNDQSNILPNIIKRRHYLDPAEPNSDGYCKDEKPHGVMTDKNSPNVDSNNQDPFNSAEVDLGRASSSKRRAVEQEPKIENEVRLTVKEEQEMDSDSGDDAANVKEFLSEDELTDVVDDSSSENMETKPIRKKRGKYGSFVRKFSKSNENMTAFIAAYRSRPKLWNRTITRIGTQERHRVLLQEIISELETRINLELSYAQVSAVIAHLRYRYKAKLNGRQKKQNVAKQWYLDELGFLRPFIECNLLSTLDSFRPEISGEHLTQILTIYNSHPTLWNSDLIENCCENKREEALAGMITAIESEMAVKIKPNTLKGYIEAIHDYITKEKENKIANKSTKARPEYHNEMKFLHDHVGPFQCSQCDRKIKNPLQFKIHKSEHDGTIPLICSLCKNEYKTIGSYAEHARRHMKDLKEKCYECGKRFLYAYSLAIHMRSHTGVNPFRCEYCGTSFRHKHAYVSHKSRHEKKYLHSCPVCSKGFYTKSEMTDHLRSHSNVRAFVCKTCGKAFKTRKTLSQHEVIHDDARKHVCDICGKAFKLRAHVWQHMKSHGKVLEKSVTVERE